MESDLPSVETSLQNVLAVYGFDEPPSAIVDALRIVIDTRDAYWQAKLAEREKQLRDVVLRMRKEVRAIDVAAGHVDPAEWCASELGIELNDD